MSNRRKELNREFHDRRPRENFVLPRYHWVRKNGGMKPKKPFETEYDARKWIETHHKDGWVAYHCDWCDKWHVSSGAKNNDGNEQHNLQ